MVAAAALRRLARACTPGFYATLHRTRFVDALRFLAVLLVAYEILRWACFVARYSDTIAGVNLDKCSREVAANFPADLQIQVRSGRFYFTQAAPVVIDLPRCVGDALALLSAYLSHGAIYPEEVWTVVAPLVVLMDRDEYLDHALESVPASRLHDALAAQGIDTSEGLPFAGHDAVFLAVGRSEAYLLDLVPVSTLVESALQAVSERTDPDDDDTPYAARVSQRSIFDAGQRLRSTLGQDPWAQRAVFGPIVLASMLCGFFISVIMSFDLLITSTIIYVLVRKGLIAASFRFWTVRQHFRQPNRLPEELFHISRASAQEEQDWLVAEYRAALAENQGADGLFAELSDAYFVSLAIHTATPALLVDALFPYMIANAIGLGAVVHMVLSLVFVRYYALPGVLMDRFVLPRLEARRRRRQRHRIQRRHERAQLQREFGGPVANEARPTDAAPRLGYAPRGIQHEWSQYRLAQGVIEETLRSQSISLNAKLTTVMAIMEYVRIKILHDEVHIIHSWSALNGTPTPEGGPGFVYGLSPSSGAWVLLCWYDHPCSERGIKALTAYPGIVHLSDKELPDSLLPTEDELLQLSASLQGLRKQLRQYEQDIEHE